MSSICKKIVFGIYFLFCFAAQADQLFTQLYSHNQLLKTSPTPANLNRALNYIKSQQVQLSLKPSLMAIDRGINVLMDPSTPNSVQRETSNNLKRIANRLNAYSDLRATLLKKMGKGSMEGVRPLNPTKNQNTVLNATRTGNRNVLRNFLERRARARGRSQQGPRTPHRDLPEVLSPGSTN